MESGLQFDLSINLKTNDAFIWLIFWGFALKLRECFGGDEMKCKFLFVYLLNQKSMAQPTGKTHNPTKYKLIKRMKVKKFDFCKYLLSFNLPTAKQNQPRNTHTKHFPHQPLRQVNRYLSRVINIRFTL